VSLLDETDCWGIKVPNILGTRFDIESKYLLRIPELPLKVCSGEKMMNQIKDFFNKNRLVEYASGVWEAYDKGIKSVWSNSYDPAYGKSWDPSQFKEVEDGLIVGPKCSGETVGIQLTISIGAEFAYIAGAGASAEYGYQIGCMDGLKAKHGSKNYVIVKLWGMNAGLRLGKGGNIGLGGNLFLYKPFNYWKHFGQELSIGYKMSLTKNMDFDVDMIFGCCDNPLKKNAAPFGVPFESIRIPAPFDFEIKIPVWPYFDMKVTGFRVGIPEHELITARETYEDIKNGQYVGGDDGNGKRKGKKGKGNGNGKGKGKKSNYQKTKDWLNKHLESSGGGSWDIKYGSSDKKATGKKGEEATAIQTSDTKIKTAKKTDSVAELPSKNKKSFFDINYPIDLIDEKDRAASGDNEGKKFLISVNYGRTCRHFNHKIADKCF